MKLEVGKTYKLNDGQVHECTRMDGDNQLWVSATGNGPFVIGGCHYHINGVFGNGGAEGYNVASCVDDILQMTLPNGDTLSEGDYGTTRAGDKVGPIVFNTFGNAGWGDSDNKVRRSSGMAYSSGMPADIDIIAKWVDTDTPTLWSDMTPEEKGALLLAHHDGKVIEIANWYGPRGWSWLTLSGVAFHVYNRYRIKPEPKVETVTLYWNVSWDIASAYNEGATHRITFNRIDGKPDPASIKMEVL